MGSSGSSGQLSQATGQRSFANTPFGFLFMHRPFFFETQLQPFFIVLLGKTKLNFPFVSSHVSESANESPRTIPDSAEERPRTNASRMARRESLIILDVFRVRSFYSLVGLASVCFGCWFSIDRFDLSEI
jgi:hypothetical protein